MNRVPSSIGFFLFAATCSFAQLPDGIVDTQPGTEAPPTPEESLGMITVPDGFHVSLFAGEPDVAQPVAIEYDDRGRLWVLESFSYIEWKRTGKDRVLIFEDTDNDGRFDTRKIFWDQGNHTSGFQIGHGGVWLCDAPELLFIPDADRDDVPDGEPEVVLDGWTTEAEHNFSTASSGDRTAGSTVGTGSRRRRKSADRAPPATSVSISAAASGAITRRSASKSGRTEPSIHGVSIGTRRARDSSLRA
ncbi:MAG: PVC-type heme-binding CxxCH protein [Verrucomicrobiales bacterium]